MGGMNSGRHGGKPTIEGCDSYVLSIGKLMGTNRRLQIGSTATAKTTWGKEFSVEIKIDLTDGWCPYLELSHAPYGDCGPKLAWYQISLQWTRPYFGGIRWWFVCPQLHERCAKLILPRGGSRFRSRKAYGLPYRSQRETSFDRAWSRVSKVYHRLGAGYLWPGDGPPLKPKWMRWLTYEKIVAKIVPDEALIDQMRALCRPNSTSNVDEPL